ncbi:MAG TPA: FapA family protein [Planctomycetota bacterium]|nr:FapA family protein [Planctomycetota bacterium]
MAITIAVAPDRMEATATIPAGDAADVDGLRLLIERHGLRAGLDKDGLGALLESAPVDRAIVIARGRPPEHGRDATIEHLVRPQEHPQAGADGVVDLHELMAFVEVEAGQALARVTPAGAGTAGLDVLGNPIPPRAGRPLDAAREYGAGTRPRAGDPEVIESEALGVMRRARDRRWEVVVPLVIEGDVDFRCGNIDTRIAVVIKGDIKAGFTVKSADSICVHGSVEDARVSAQGDLDVRGGILPGARRVKAHGDVHARFIEEREVKGRDIEAKAGILHATVLATGGVRAKDIVGGRITVAGSVACTTLGSPAEVPTVVEVGVDPFADALISELDRRCRFARDHVAELGERAKLLAHAIARNGDPVPGEASALRAVQGERTRLIAQIGEWEAALVEARERHAAVARAPLVSTVAVGGYAHAGVELRFRDVARVRLLDSTPRPRFHCVDGAIAT